MRGALAGIFAIIILSSSGCAPLIGAEAGNPNNDAYLGGAGSVYDESQNPAQTVGSVAYAPATAPAKMPADSPMSQTLSMASPSAP